MLPPNRNQESPCGPIPTPIQAGAPERPPTAAMGTILLTWILLLLKLTGAASYLVRPRSCQDLQAAAPPTPANDVARHNKTAQPSESDAPVVLPDLARALPPGLGVPLAAPPSTVSASRVVSAPNAVRPPRPRTATRKRGAANLRCLKRLRRVPSSPELVDPPAVPAQDGATALQPPSSPSPPPPPSSRSDPGGASTSAAPEIEAGVSGRPVPDSSSSWTFSAPMACVLLAVEIVVVLAFVGVLGVGLYLGLWPIWSRQASSAPPSPLGLLDGGTLRSRTSFTYVTPTGRRITVPIVRYL